MSVVVAHLSTPEGREALDSAATEAVRRGTELVVVVTEASTSTPSSSPRTRTTCDAWRPDSRGRARRCVVSRARRTSRTTS